MYQVTKEFQLNGWGHRLVDGYQSKCHSVHGHNLVVKVTLESLTLNQYSFVRDFGDFKPLKQWFDENWDHATVLKQDDYVAIEHMSQIDGQRLYISPVNPTSENLARFLYDLCHQLFADEAVRVASVEVDETCTSKAIYFPGV